MRSQQFRRPEPEQSRRDQKRSRPEKEIRRARRERADEPDVVLNLTIGRGDVSQPVPAWNVPRVVGNQREEQKGPQPQQEQADYFVKHSIFWLARHSEGF